MVKSRNKGNSFEQKIARELRKLGFKNCETSRFASKKTDDQKVDFVNTGDYNFQAKAWERAPSYHDVLREMPDKGINVIIHKRNYKGEVVVLLKEDFFNLIKQLL